MRYFHLLKLVMTASLLPYSTHHLTGLRAAQTMLISRGISTRYCWRPPFTLPQHLTPLKGKNVRDSWTEIWEEKENPFDSQQKTYANLALAPDDACHRKCLRMVQPSSVKVNIVIDRSTQTRRSRAGKPYIMCCFCEGKSISWPLMAIVVMLVSMFLLNL